MAANKLPYDISVQNIGREFGGQSVHGLIHRLNALNVRKWEDYFIGDTIHSGYATVTGVDGTFSIESDDDHAKLAASTGTGASGEYCGAALPGLAVKGDRYPVIMCRLALDVITTVKVEFGLTDAKDDAGAVNALATPTFTADDAVVWILDTDDTGYWQCCGVKDGTGATKIEPGIAPTAATYEYLGIAVRDTFAKFLRWNDDGYLTYESAWMEDAITKTDPLTPWVFVQLRGACDRNVQFEMLRCYWNFTNA